MNFILTAVMVMEPKVTQAVNSALPVGVEINRRVRERDIVMSVLVHGFTACLRWMRARPLNWMGSPGGVNQGENRRKCLFEFLKCARVIKGIG